MRDKLKPVVKTEEQFLFVCHLVGPFFQRFHIERTRCMLDVSCAANYLLVYIIRYDAQNGHVCLEVIVQGGCRAVK